MSEAAQTRCDHESALSKAHHSRSASETAELRELEAALQMLARPTPQGVKRVPAHVTLQDGGRATTALTLTLDLPVDATVGDLRTTAARALSLTLESFLVRNFDGGVLESEEQSLTEARVAAFVTLEPNSAEARRVVRRIAAFTHVLRAELAREEVFENQRFYPAFGWQRVLLPHDGKAWSDASLRHAKTKATAVPDKEWEWVGDWGFLSADWTDGNGWTYGSNFKSLLRRFHRGHSRPKWRHLVRQRRWRRLRRKVQELPFDPLEACAPEAEGDSEAEMGDTPGATPDAAGSRCSRRAAQVESGAGDSGTAGADAQSTCSRGDAVVLPPPPAHLVCPLTQRLFERPVVTKHGNTYEAAAVEELLAGGGGVAVDKLAGEPITREDVWPNRAVEADVAWWRAHATSTRAAPNSEPPDHLTCPITFELFDDPLVTRYGHTFEREELMAVLESAGEDPLTRKPLTKADVAPNLTLRRAVEVYRAQRGRHMRQRSNTV